MTWTSLGSKYWTDVKLKISALLLNHFYVLRSYNKGRITWEDICDYSTVAVYIAIIRVIR